MALPATIILLAVIGVIGTKIYLVMAILGVLISAAVYRVMLGVAQSVRQRLYVDAARVNGLGSLRVNLRARAAVDGHRHRGAGRAAVRHRPADPAPAWRSWASVPAEPQPSWGFMIQDASQHIYDAPVAAWCPPASCSRSPSSRPTSWPTPSPARARRREAPRPPRRRRRVVASSAAAPADPDRRPRGPRPVRGGRRRSGAGHRRLLRPAARPGARPGRRVRLRQDDDRPLAAGPAARRRLGVRRRRSSGRAASWSACPRAELNAVRGREIAMISQEPMVALDPMFSVAYQLTQPIRRFRGVGRARGEDDRRRAAPPGRHRRRRAGAEELPAPALRRHGAAGLHRARADRRAEAADRRRADHRARRHRAGRDPQPAAGAGPRHRPVGGHRQPRPRRRRRHLRRRRGHVRRRGRRVRLRRRRAGRPRAPVHDGAARGEPARARRRAGAAAAGVDPRHRARRPARGRPAAASPPAASSRRSSAPCRSSSLPAHGDGSVRCIRVEELARANATWDADDVGAEIVVGADPLEPSTSRPDRWSAPHDRRPRRRHRRARRRAGPGPGGPRPRRPLRLRAARRGTPRPPSTASASTSPRARPSASSASPARASRRSARPSSACSRRRRAR